MKRKISIIVAVVMLLLGGVQVYAATALDSNIIALIQSGFDSIRSYYSSIVESQSANIDLKYSQQVDDHINKKTSDVINDIESYKNSEINRADQELNQYVQDANQQVDSIMDQQAKDIKNSITQDVNAQIASVKSDIDKEYEKMIKDIVKK